MQRVCRNCKKEYSYCPSCAEKRPYLNRFCSLKCREEFIKKQEIEVQKLQELKEQKSTNQ